MMRMINHYFRDPQPDDANAVRSTYYPHSLRAGVPLPKSRDGKVYNVIFEACDFHPNCQAVEYVGCTFINCYNIENFNHTDCTFIERAIKQEAQ
jgi:hypothetical protein